MQLQVIESVAQQRRHRLSHDTLSPVGTVHFVTQLNAPIVCVEAVKTARADDHIRLAVCHAPAERFAPGIACMNFLDPLMRVIQRMLLWMPVELHRFRIAEYLEEVFRIRLLDLTQEQSICRDNGKYDKS